MNDQSAMVTSSAILEEVATFLNSRNKHSLAVRVGNYLLESPAIDVVHIDAVLFSAGWNYFVQHQDKQYSLTDCFSFLVMQQRDLWQALTFDKHFQQAGFEILPQTN